MLAIGVLGGLGYLMQKPSELQKAQQKEQQHEAKMQELRPVNARTGVPVDTAAGAFDSDYFPDVPLRGGYGDQYSPAYLNADWQLGTAITKGHKQTVFQEAPLPSTFLGLKDMNLGDDIRARTMMNAPQYQTDMNNFNGENGWAQGMALVSRPNPQQAQIDSRRVPITTLSKPSLGSIVVGPDDRRPNPTTVLGVAFDTAARGGLNEMVRLPERASAFENQMGAATPGGTGNANMRPEILNLNPYGYTRTPKHNCYIDLQWDPAGNMGANGFFGDTRRGYEGQVVRKKDSVLGQVGGKAAHLGNVIYPDAITKEPLTAEVEARLPGGTYVDNPNHCDRIDMSMEGLHVSPLPVGKDVENRETAAQNLPGFTPQNILPFQQGQRQAQELLIQQDVGGADSLELHAGTLLGNPYHIAPDYVSRSIAVGA